MFKVKGGNKTYTVYAVKEENGVIYFLLYAKPYMSEYVWMWQDAKMFVPCEE